MSALEEDFWRRAPAESGAVPNTATTSDDDEFWGRAAQDDLVPRRQTKPDRPSGSASRPPISVPRGTPNVRDQSARTARRYVAAVAVLIAASAAIIATGSAVESEPSTLRYVNAVNLGMGERLTVLERNALEAIDRQRSRQRAQRRAAARQAARRRARTERRRRARAAERRAAASRSAAAPALVPPQRATSPAPAATFTPEPVAPPAPPRRTPRTPNPCEFPPC